MWFGIPHAICVSCEKISFSPRWPMWKMQEHLVKCDSVYVPNVHRQKPLRYDRQILINILVYHYRKNASDCGCGWAELGKLHSEHVADVYEDSVRLRRIDGNDPE